MQQRRFIGKVMKFLYISLGMAAVVIPNSLPLETFGLLLILAVVAATTPGFRNFPRRYALMMSMSILVTLVYLTVGVLNGAPGAAVWQILLAYVLTPGLWAACVFGAIRRFPGATVARGLALLTVPATLSVALYFYLFLNFGPSSVTFFFDQANVHIQGSTIAARMHVYGSLIFLAGGFFSTPEVFYRKPSRLLIALLLIGAAMTSGRAALIASIPIGFFVFILPRLTSNFRLKSVLIGFFVVAVGVFSAFGLMQSLGVSIQDTMGMFLQKLMAGGGAVRDLQSEALWDSISTHIGLGAGHGIATKVIRNEEYPWRYELIWLATLHRVGVIGTAIYAFPFLWYLFSASRALLINRLSTHERFFFGGFLAAFVASSTNPYLEAFSLQWMFIVPMVDWFTSHPTRRNPNSRFIPFAPVARVRTRSPFIART
jgi:hypothetical protein